jgi:hypothetical protein
MKWENLSRLMTLVEDDIKRISYFEMSMQKGKSAKVEI